MTDSFDTNALTPVVRAYLSALPLAELGKIGAKRVRKALVAQGACTSEDARTYKQELEAMIGDVFFEVSAQRGVGAAGEGEEEGEGSNEGADEEEGDGAYKEEEDEAEESEAKEEEEDEKPKKKKKRQEGTSQERADEELARRLSDELNGRGGRATRAGATTGGTKKAKAGKGSKKGVKSAARVDSDIDSEEDTPSRTGAKRKRSKAGGGAAKGGFAKEYTLSGPLAGIVGAPRMSRPQVVKQLWVYIKGNELQNPANKRQIMCDPGLRAVFNADKIDMFQMNKVLGQHLSEE